MKTKIKNARRLETTIIDEVRRLEMKMRRSNNTYPSYTESAKQTEAYVRSIIETYKRMNVIKFHIREAIGAFNAEEGINAHTLEIAQKQALIDMWDKVSEISEPQSTSSFRYEATEPIKYSGGISDTYAEEIHAKILKLNREIVRLKDKCMGVNSMGSIEINNNDYTFLQEKGLLD